MEILTSSLGTSLKKCSATKACELAPKNIDKQLPTMPEMNELAPRLVSGSDSVLQSEEQDLPILHPSTRLQLINQYVGVLSDLAQEKVSFSLQVVHNLVVFFSLWCLICTEVTVSGYWCLDGLLLWTCLF